MALAKRQSNRKLVAEINVVPYIDVMLVLLVIFMITAPLLTQGVKVDLPKAQAQAINAQNQQPIIVTVDKDGNYYLNLSDQPSVPIDPQSLVNRVAAQLLVDKQQNLQRDVLVKGDQAVNYGKVVQAMALLQQAGADKVGLMTDDTQSQNSSPQS